MPKVLIMQVMFVGLLLGQYHNLLAQDSTVPKITIPFDSLVVKDFKLTGNVLKGGVTISMRYENQYSKIVNVHFKLGGFENFGLTDDKGNKYKIYSRESLIGPANINKGYYSITSVVFGSSKLDYYTAVVEQVLKPGESKMLTIQIGKVNRNVNYIRDFHINCSLMLDYMFKGEKTYNIENLRILWSKT